MSTSTTDKNQKHQGMLTPQGVADYLNISIQTVYRYLNGEGVSYPMPSYKFSKKNIRIKKEELDLWVTKNLQNTTYVCPKCGNQTFYKSDVCEKCGYFETKGGEK